MDIRTVHRTITKLRVRDPQKSEAMQIFPRRGGRHLPRWIDTSDEPRSGTGSQSCGGGVVALLVHPGLAFWEKMSADRGSERLD